MLQKMMMRRTQKKTAMTAVPTRITISMLPRSSEPAWAETAVCACAPRAPLLVAARSRRVRGGTGGGCEARRTFHGHAGRGVDAALGVAHAAQVAASVLLAHALDAQLLVRVGQIDPCRRRGQVQVWMGLGPGPPGPPHQLCARALPYRTFPPAAARPCTT